MVKTQALRMWTATERQFQCSREAAEEEHFQLLREVEERQAQRCGSCCRCCRARGSRWRKNILVVKMALPPPPTVLSKPPSRCARAGCSCSLQVGGRRASGWQRRHGNFIHREHRWSWATRTQARGAPRRRPCTAPPILMATHYHPQSPRHSQRGGEGACGEDATATHARREGREGRFV